MAEKQMSPAEQEARGMIADMKLQKASEKAYDKADKTPAAPAPKKAFAKGGSVFRASANGIAQRGKTRGKMC
jgi:hypothetical protein